jgi:Helix-turn-helix domain
MDTFFFRVDHSLLRSEAFKSLGGSSIKVYLIIGLYSDFGTGWAYPSIRTIAKQGGMSRQTVLDAIAELTSQGLLATSKARGKATAYKIIRQGPERSRSGKRGVVQDSKPSVPKFFQDGSESVLDSFNASLGTGSDSWEVMAQYVGQGGLQPRPKQEPTSREEDNHSIPIPGTPFRLTADGRLLVAVDVRELLTSQGLPERLAEKLARQRQPEEVAKVLLNALYLQSQGKLQNGPGYIRTAIEGGYELLPQVATRLELRRRAFQDQLRASNLRRELREDAEDHASEEAAITLLIESLHPEELTRLIERAVSTLPTPIVRRNPTLSNPFVRAKVYELAGGLPTE